jgi:hypothetical protein
MDPSLFGRALEVVEVHLSIVLVSVTFPRFRLMLPSMERRTSIIGPGFYLSESCIPNHIVSNSRVLSSRTKRESRPSGSTLMGRETHVNEGNYRTLELSVAHGDSHDYMFVH